MKEQLKKHQLDEDEEICLRKLVTKSEGWDDIGYPSNDKVRRTQLQAIIRRYIY
ncbi:hypothetical protein SLEP1_g50430 [Rubroshorea leprosula]|uniref:Uncharacterized protein n=1 Tax=Rubroshorea leprosula TaxID=152421 RepID=A0AAV5M0W4_9ROSI|nr:hypothetical protein SLEP1_g50430 [Rubroshorea leprosula]